MTYFSLVYAGAVEVLPIVDSNLKKGTVREDKNCFDQVLIL